MPTLAVRDAEGWHLDPDTDPGDSRFALAAAWRAAIRVPAEQRPDDSTDDDSTDVVDRGGACALAVLARDLGRGRFLALPTRGGLRLPLRVIHPARLPLARGGPSIRRLPGAGRR